MNQRIEKSEIIYGFWESGDGDINELAIGLYNLLADYKALLEDYEQLEDALKKIDGIRDWAGEWGIGEFETASFRRLWDCFRIAGDAIAKQEAL